jgi:hypothetical protein
MSNYWRKKLNEKKIRCCGRLKNGGRCKNNFYPMETTYLTCTLHRSQLNVTYCYSSEVGQFKDVAKLIAIQIDDPTTFARFAKVCRSTAKACHELQKIKIGIWKKKILFGDTYILPDGSTADKDNNIIQRNLTGGYFPQLYKSYK